MERIKIARALPVPRIKELNSCWSASVDVSGVAHCASGETRKAAVATLRRDLAGAIVAVAAERTPPFLAAIEALLPEEHD